MRKPPKHAESYYRPPEDPGIGGIRALNMKARLEMKVRGSVKLRAPDPCSHPAQMGLPLPRPAEDKVRAWKS